MSYTQIYYHIIYSTKNRVAVLEEERRKNLYNYLWGILKNNKCHLYQMGGTDDHIHLKVRPFQGRGIFIEFSPQVAFVTWGYSRFVTFGDRKMDEL